MIFFEQFFKSDFISEYNHSNYIDSLNGMQFFHMDCSGFVYWALAKMGYKRALVEIRCFLRRHGFIKINRLFCKDFALLYKNADTFKYWQFLPQPQPGCIMVVLFPDKNGHCMFISKIMEQNFGNTTLRIIDCTRYPHKNDTRASTITGIGIGDINIIHDKGNRYLYNSGNCNLNARLAEVYFILPLKQPSLNAK